MYLNLDFGNLVLSTEIKNGDVTLLYLNNKVYYILVTGYLHQNSECSLGMCCK